MTTRSVCTPLAVALLAFLAACGGPATAPTSTSGPSPALPTGVPITPVLPSAPLVTPLSTTAASFPVALPGAVPSRVAVVVGAPDASTILVLVPGSAEPERAFPGEQAAWSPDGRRIAYVCKHAQGELPGLCVADVSGPETTPELVLRETISVTWSPEGSVLAIGRSPIDTGDTFVVRPDGSGLRPIGIEGYAVRADAWSPDGKGLAGHASFEGTSPPEAAVCSVDNVCRRYGRGTAQAWSTDGTAIAIARPAGQGVEILDVASGVSTPVNGLGTRASLVAWSSRGAMAAVDDPDGEVVDGELIVMTSPDAEPVLPAPGLLVHEVRWSPDGAWLGLIAADAGAGATAADLWIVRPDGTGLARITDSGDVRSLAWSPAP